MAKDFSFEIHKKLGNARLGTIHTRNGKIQTPAFVPVATVASIKSLDSDDLEKLNPQCILANTYHLNLKPGPDVLRKAGGVRGLMNFNRPLFSDSGGFQAFSLGIGMSHGVGKIGAIDENKSTEHIKKSFAKVTDEGVAFKSIYDGSKHFLNAKNSMDIQSALGSDIIMAFDECTSPMSNKKYQQIAMERTHRWAIDSIKYKDPEQALYGIIQGGEHKDLRIESAKFINNLPFEGIAIGGSFGDSVHNMYDIIEWIIPHLDDRPRHLLGIGNVDDIFKSVEMGIDTFDCVSPTRNARRGGLFLTPKGGGSKKNKFRINIDRKAYNDDFTPIDSNCTCSTCQKYTKAYLKHLFVLKETAFHRLATIHNLHFMLRLMENIREALANDTYEELKNEWLGEESQKQD